MRKEKTKQEISPSPNNFRLNRYLNHKKRRNKYKYFNTGFLTILTITSISFKK